MTDTATSTDATATTSAGPATGGSYRPEGGTKLRAPVADWTTDFDHVHPDYAVRAPEIWDELRSECPVAHSDRYGGTWLPVRHEDVCAIAKDTDTFSSKGVVVFRRPSGDPSPGGLRAADHQRPALPSHRPRVPAARLRAEADCGQAWRPPARSAGSCSTACWPDVEAGRTDIVDAALGYTQHIPVLVIADMLGVPSSDGGPVPGLHPPDHGGARRRLRDRIRGHDRLLPRQADHGPGRRAPRRPDQPHDPRHHRRPALAARACAGAPALC